MENREILISADEYEKRVAILDSGQLKEFFLERENSGHLAGNLYKGRVAQVVKGMEAAFVDIGLGKNGFLYIDELLPEQLGQEEFAVVPSDNPEEPKKEKPPVVHRSIENMLSKGQEVLVQVVKEPFGTKGCRLTTQVSLPGRFLVLMPYSTNIGISKRITQEKERDRLRALLKEIGLPKDVGCIVRTQALNMGKREFERELNYLLNLWKTIKAKSAKRNAPCLIHQEFDLVLRTTRDWFSEDVKRLVIDRKEDYKRIMGFIHTLAPHLKRRVEFYREKMNLFEKFVVEEQIEKIFRKQISLKKGGYLIIEKTEALISIDVNSGSFVDRGRLEETAFLTNMEAAKEIANQIILKDLAGIIIIDFIDMQVSSHRKKVFQVLQKCLESDKARLTIYPFSPLGIVQIARQRIRKNIEMVMFEECPCCRGQGRIKSTQSIAIKVLRAIKLHLMSQKKRQLQVSVNPQIATRLFNEDRVAITNMEKRFWVKIAILADEHLGIEDVKFL